MLGIQQVKEILRAKWTGGSITPQGSNQPIQEPSMFINQSYENVGSDLVCEDFNKQLVLCFFYPLTFLLKGETRNH